MTQQVQNRQGRIINPLHAILFVTALLVFIFTVIYRMAKSESFSSAVATLIESLLIVSFFTFFGILLAYLFYFIHERVRPGSGHQQLWDMLFYASARNESTGKSDPSNMELDPSDEAESRPNS